MSPHRVAWFESEEGRFQIRGVVGRGAYSVVYRAYDRETRTEVALKVLEGWNPQELYRLKREFRLLRSLRHPSLVEFYELFSSPSRGTFFSMEFVDGAPLLGESTAASAPGPSPTSRPLDPSACAELLAAARELVDALNLVHAAGIVHRDVKPSNILKRLAGGVVLLDFGLAAHRDPDGIDTLVERGLAGTWVYMAPEAILGRAATPACDWYSLAVLLFEAITGQPAFAGTAAEVWQAKQRGLIPSCLRLAGRVPEGIAEVIVASLDPDPNSRPDGASWSRALAEADRSPTAGLTPFTGAAATATSNRLFVGRAAELDELADAYRQAVRGHTVIARISGPGGIGKTELVRQFLGEIPLAESPLILRARCHWQESVPFNAVDGIVDELALWLRAHDPGLLGELTEFQQDCLARMFPVLGPDAPQLSEKPQVQLHPAEVRRVAFEAMRLLFAHLATVRPLVLWIDDGQWADADSAALLSAVFRSPDAPRALILVCQRSEQADEVLPLLDDASARAWAELVRQVPVGPLSADAARELALGCSPKLAENSFEADQILREAEGSPLLIAQLAQHVGRSAMSSPSPSLALPQVVGVRVDSLPAAARRILDLAAVAVRPINSSLLLRVAGLGEGGRRFVSLLDAVRLLQSTRVGGEVCVEPYHQRIGDAVRSRLSRAELERCHALLAEHLATESVVEEERVFYHWRAGGRLTEATEWALLAAERAGRQLAFEKAVELYTEALALGCVRGAEQRANVERKRAEMLANAGRGAAAAPIFLALAEQASDAAFAHDLRRRAAEEYLMSGHLREGTAALRAVLQRVGVNMPASPAGALVRSLLWLLPLWLAERRARRGGHKAVLPEADARCDACHSAAKGLSFVDPPRGLYFSMHALRWALAAGGPRRMARGLSFVGSNLLPMGGFFARWSSHMIERAGALARMSDEPYLEATTALAIAQMRMMECRWAEMLTLCERARAIFREQCPGSAWEVSVATMAALRALEELGHLPELHRQAVAMIQEAERTGNLYAEVTGLLNEGFCLLAQGDPVEAWRLADESSRRWKTEGFHVQHFYAARLKSLCALYEGHTDEAVRSFAAPWRAMQQSGLLRHTIYRIDALTLRARLLLAELAHEQKRSARARHRVERVVNKLAQEGRVDSSAWSLVLRATLANWTDEGERALEWLTAAQQKFESASMSVGAAIGGYGAAQKCAAPVAEKLRQQSSALFSTANIASPRRFVHMLAPGLCGDGLDG
ncbi:MAG: AAA family ATPase [Candidatus Binatia bacterium]|nr:AAA family ATPase [Candidatus Binatia bacterium]